MRYKLKLNLEWMVEDDDVLLDDDELRNLLQDKLNDEIMSNNETVDNIFWEGMEVEVIPDNEDDFAPSIATIIKDEEV